MSEKQKKLSAKLVELHPIIYEEERCQKCSAFSKTLSTYNKQASILRSESATESDLIDWNLGDSNEVSDDLDEFANAEKRAVLKEDLMVKIRELNTKYAKHRATHDSMTLKEIEKIERTFSQIENCI